MYVLREPSGAEWCRADNEEDLWVGFLPGIPWPGMDADKVLETIRDSHSSRGWTVTKED